VTSMFSIVRICNATGTPSLPAKVVPIEYRSVYVVHRSGLGETAAEIAEAFCGGCQEAAAVTGRRMPYTHVIRRDGMIEQAIPWSTVAPHAAAWNTRSASVALVGDFREHAPTVEQWDSLVGLCTLAAVLIGGANGIYGHDELNGSSLGNTRKRCPGHKLSMTLLRRCVRDDILRLCHDAGMVW